MSTAVGGFTLTAWATASGADQPAAIAAALAIGVWSLLMLDDRPRALLAAIVVTLLAAAPNPVLAPGDANPALGALLASALLGAAIGTIGRWLASRSRLLAQTLMMLGASAIGYIALIGLATPGARGVEALPAVAVLLPIGMSWLLIHRMDWAQRLSGSELAAAIGFGVVFAAASGAAFGAWDPGTAVGWQLTISPETTIALPALLGALLALQAGQRRLALALIAPALLLALYGIAVRDDPGRLVPLTDAGWLGTRMRVGSATMIAISGIVLGLGVMLHQRRGASTLVGFGGLVAVLVASTSLFGNLAGLPRELTPGLLDGTVPGRLALLLLGIGMLLSRGRREPDPQARALWLPLALAAVVAAGTIHLALAQYRNDDASWRRNVAAAQRSVEAGIQGLVAARVVSVERFAQRLMSVSPAERERLFDVEISQALSAGVGLESVLWVDAERRIRQIVSRMPAPGALGVDAAFDAERRAGYDEAAAGTRAVVVGPLLSAVSDAPALLIVQPISPEPGRIEFVTAAYGIDALFAAALANAAVGYDLELRSGTDARFRHVRGSTSAAAWRGVESTEIRIAGRPWRLRLARSDGQPSVSALPAIVLWSGLAIAALVGIAVRLAMVGRMRARLAETANVALRRAAEWDQKQNEAMAAIASGRPIDECLALVARLYELRFPGATCAVLRYDADAGRVVDAVAPGLSDAFVAIWRGTVPGPDACSCGTAIHRRALVVVEDIASDPICAAFREATLAEGLRAAWSKPIEDGQGRVLGTFAVFQREPGAPDEAELAGIDAVGAIAALALAHEHNQRRVEQSRQRFLSLFERSPSAVLALGLDGRVVECNREALAQAVMPREALVGGSGDALVAEALRGAAREHFGLAALGLAQGFETAVAVPGRGLREVRATLVPIAVDGRIDGVFAIIDDITERNRVARELEQALADLRLRNRELQDFAFVATHDLQEPLRKIRAFSDRVIDRFGPGLPLEGVDYLRRIDAAGQRMQVLLEDVLAYSRVTSQGQPFEPVDLAAVARDVVSDLEVRIDESAAEVEIGELPTIEGDRTQLRQLLQNLIANSLKFRAADRAPHVRLEAGPAPDEPGAVLLSVEDNGIGFEAQYAERIFVPFQRLHDRGSYEGTGIGLAVVRKIVERHRGRIVAHGRPGQGARVEVTLPRVQAA